MNDEAGGSLWQTTLRDFRDRTASASPTPGGGSVASVSASLGIGLVIMALEISGKRKDAKNPEEVQALIDKGRSQMALLSEDADNDVAAFRGYMSALKLPKQTDEEKCERTNAIGDASYRATQAPLSAARHILEALQIAGAAIPLTHAHVVSDVGAGASLLGGAMTAILYNVDINLPSIKDEDERARFASERTRLEEAGTRAARSILERVSLLLA